MFPQPDCYSLDSWNNKAVLEEDGGGGKAKIIANEPKGRGGKRRNPRSSKINMSIKNGFFFIGQRKEMYKQEIVWKRRWGKERMM